MKGRRYDAYWLRKKHGSSTWWDGLDPQELYTGPSFVPPAGINSIAAMNEWHGARDGQWMEHAPPQNPAFVRKWLLRQKDLVEKYRPDIVYLDDSRIPFGQTGIEAVAHYCNQSLAWHGRIDGVLTAKQLSPYQRFGIVEDVERGLVEEIRPQPWQTSTCIGQWHYDRGLYERHGYKSAKTVIQRLADIVSKDGNLLLSIPQRGDGSIDEDEVAILQDLADWFARSGEAIYDTRPWRRFGEGPNMPKAGFMNEGDARPFTSADIRFTASQSGVNAIFLEWPLVRRRSRRSVATSFPRRKSNESNCLEALRFRSPATVKRFASSFRRPSAARSYPPSGSSAPASSDAVAAGVL